MWITYTECIISTKLGLKILNVIGWSCCSQAHLFIYFVFSTLNIPTIRKPVTKAGLVQHLIQVHLNWHLHLLDCNVRMQSTPYRQILYLYLIFLNIGRTFWPIIPFPSVHQQDSVWMNSMKSTASLRSRVLYRSLGNLHVRHFLSFIVT